MAGGLHPIFLVEEAVKAIGLVDAHGHSLIPVNVLYSWTIMAILIVLALMATKKISLVPKGLQNFFEFLIGSLEDFVVANMGEDGRKVFPVLATLFIYILCCNVGGMFPGATHRRQTSIRPRPWPCLSSCITSIGASNCMELITSIILPVPCCGWRLSCSQ